jgi:hypothetical protein
MAVKCLPHLRVSFGGGIGQPNVEIWSNTVNFGNPVVEIPNEPEVASLPAVFAPVVQTWFAAADTQIGASAELQWIKAVWILSDGHQRDTNTAIYDYPVAIGGSIAAPCIWEQTYAITLRTANKRGRGHAGRIYPPLSGAGPANGSPYITELKATAMATTAKALLDGLVLAYHDSIGAPDVSRDLHPVVISNVDALNPLPLMTRITSVVVDRVADIQHRRTNRVPRLEAPAQALA